MRKLAYQNYIKFINLNKTCNKLLIINSFILYFYIIFIDIFGMMDKNFNDYSYYAS